MKLHYYLMSMALMATASVSFTACDDDDPVDEPVYIVGGDKTDTPDIEFSQADIRVKIGEENRASIPVASATGVVKAFSLNPDIAQIVDVDGTPMIEGVKNGTCDIMVSDANNNYKKLSVSVYTTDEMQLSASEVTLSATIGTEATSEASVVLGNGQYSIKSDNDNVNATINAETGAIQIKAITKKNDYTAILTVTDISGLTATLAVTVHATLISDTLELSANTLNFEGVLGATSSNSTIMILKGNGSYKLTSDNPAVTAKMGSGPGAANTIVITATTRIKEYTATVTVTDAADFEATVKVTVKAILEPFTQTELNNIKNQTDYNVWGDCKDPSDGKQPYYWNYRKYGYGEYINETANGLKTLGWWCDMYGSDYGGLKISYDANATVGQEVSGTLYYQYSNISWYALYTYPGTAKVLVDDADKTIVICWQLDQENERYNRGYVVMKK